MQEDDRLFKRKDITGTHIYSSNCYCIMRVGKSYKSISSMTGYKKYVTREIEVPNADKGRTPLNEILIGNDEFVNDAKDFLKDTFIRRNSVIGREIMLSSSPEFFKNISPADLELWKKTNVEWLKTIFGENCIFCIAHHDQKTVHLHCFVIPRIYNVTYGKYTLQNYQYFGGSLKLRALQDNYYEHMSRVFPILQRGIKYSKQENMSIKDFYKKIDENVNVNDIESIKAKAAESDILKEKLEYVNRTLEYYQKNLNMDEYKNMLSAAELEKEIYKQVVDKLSITLDIPKTEIQSLIEHERLERSNYTSNERKID